VVGVADGFGTGVSVWMPSKYYLPGDTCTCQTIVCNAEETSLLGYPLFVVLELLGNYYFAPSFSDFDHYDPGFGYPVGETTMVVIPEFFWPEGAGTVSEATWYGALTNPELTDIFGEFGTFTFGWGE